MCLSYQSDVSLSLLNLAERIECSDFRDETVGYIAVAISYANERKRAYGLTQKIDTLDVRAATLAFIVQYLAKKGKKDKWCKEAIHEALIMGYQVEKAHERAYTLFVISKSLFLLDIIRMAFQTLKGSLAAYQQAYKKDELDRYVTSLQTIIESVMPLLKDNELQSKFVMTIQLELEDVKNTVLDDKTNIHRDRILLEVSHAYALLDDYQKATNAYKNIEDQYYRAIALLKMANVYFKSGKVEEAKQRIEKAIEIAQKISRLFDRAELLVWSYQELINIGETERIRERIGYVMKISEEIQYEPYRIAILSSVLESLALLGNLKEALELANQKIGRSEKYWYFAGTLLSITRRLYASGQINSANTAHQIRDLSEKFFDELKAIQDAEDEMRYVMALLNTARTFIFIRETELSCQVIQHAISTIMKMSSNEDYEIATLTAARTLSEMNSLE